MRQGGKILITGSGRSGTTFVVKLLTELGLDTGFTRREGHWVSTLAGLPPPKWRRAGRRQPPFRYAPFFPSINAGLEIYFSPDDDPAVLERLPRVLKDPRLCWNLRPILERRCIEVDHVFVLVRDLHEVSRSRIKGTRWPYRFGVMQRLRTRTGLPFYWDSAAQIGELLVDLGRFEVPYSLLFFPRVAEDARYALDKLRPVLTDEQCRAFLPAFTRVSERIAPEAAGGDEGREPRT